MILDNRVPSARLVFSIAWKNYVVSLVHYFANPYYRPNWEVYTVEAYDMKSSCQIKLYIYIGYNYDQITNVKHFDKSSFSISPKN